MEDVDVEYDQKWWGTMLMNHLDETAKGELIGFEKNYEECMKRLQGFYGDSTKVVYCVMREVTSQSVIADGDYNSLSSYTDKLESSYNCQKNIHLEHEMSNTASMNSILKKLPRLVGEDWFKFPSTQIDSINLRPF